MQNRSAESPNNSDVDFQALVYSFWYHKWLILIIVSLSTLAAALYAFTARPIYEAKIFLLAPTVNDISAINYGRTQDSGLEPLKADAIYKVFLQALSSEALRQVFFNTIYLPSVTDDARKISQGELYQRLSKSLLVELPTKDGGDQAIVTVQSADPEQALSWAQDYVDRASTMAKAEIYKDVSSENTIRARNLFHRIESLREVSRKLREDSITKLQEALRIAEAVGLENSPIIMRNSGVEVAGDVDGQALYMRGTKALKAEIENLKRRESDDPFSIDLRRLESSYDFYKELESYRADISVYRQDGLARYPDSPIKPKRMLILSLGLILGLMMGGAVSLVLYFFGKKR
ncbi:Wzz/FepE/Etk N-terminal domain-containing protein [Pseudomonas sp. MRSN 12121]|uniref:Wzz/FepE/Etk N-terminal domain-containing protein n=1 Tax=Pseudomonas sp. MRSN 12121 TaxID=1611770 RepID=UPI0009E40345|nr:Wzz/FepE/Etk N-terminal domain-containing protein [Pseudomonas sp. MRSN 12121]